MWKTPEHATRSLIVSRCYYDLRLFAQLFFPHHCGKPFNKFHLDWFKTFEPDEKRRRLNVLASRGSAKTTLVSLIDILHRLCYGAEKFTVIFSSVEPLAREKLKNIKHEILENKALQYFYNLRPLGSRLLSEEIEVQSDFGESKVISKGFLSQVRGLIWRGNRPTRFIFDDISHGERVFSLEQREKALRHFRGDIHNAQQPDTNHINIGTPIFEGDIPTLLAKNPAWETWKYPSIISWPKNEALWQKWEKIYGNLDDPDRKEKGDEFYKENKEKMDEGAEVLWPERESLYFLRKELIEIGRRAFDCEKQTKTFSSSEALFKKIFWFNDEDFNFRNRENWRPFYALDPATGEEKKPSSSKKLSNSSRVVGYLNERTDVLYIASDVTDRESPSEVIREMHAWNKEFKFHRMVVEENLFRDLHSETTGLIKKTEFKEDPPLQLYSVFSHHKKENRIYQIEPMITAGRVRFSKSISGVAKGELESYPFSGTNDFLDAVELMTKAAYSPVQLKSVNIDL